MAAFNTLVMRRGRVKHDFGGASGQRQSQSASHLALAPNDALYIRISAPIRRLRPFVPGLGGGIQQFMDHAISKFTHARNIIVNRQKE